MGETRLQRAQLIAQLANLDPHPESVPINVLSRVPGTPLEDAADQKLMEASFAITEQLEQASAVAGARPPAMAAATNER